MAKTLDLLDLIPAERNHVRFPNKKVVDAYHMEEMEPGQYANFIKMNSRITKLEGMLDGAELGDPEEAVKNMNEMHSILGDILKVIMVDIDDETLSSASMFTRGRVMEWWTDENKAAPKVLGQESQS